MIFLAEYVTVKKQASDELTEKRSRFIGYIKPVTSEEEAVAFISEIRSKHWDARHNVYAYSLRENNICRYSDDGEPSGTAGQPVLSVLTKSGTTDAVIVVTRYFGGVLLGTGGLVRAYSAAASLALKAGEPVVMRRCVNCSLSCDYDRYGKLASLIPECEGVIDDTVFGADVSISFHMEDGLLGSFEKKLADATNGSVTFSRGTADFFET